MRPRIREVRYSSAPQLRLVAGNLWICRRGRVWSTSFHTSLFKVVQVAQLADVGISTDLRFPRGIDLITKLGRGGPRLRLLRLTLFVLVEYVSDISVVS